MDILYELVRYILSIIIGIFLIRWYIEKKGWENSFGNCLFFIFSWKSIMFFILCGLEILWDVDLDYLYATIIYSITVLTISFFINICLGTVFFGLILKQKLIESIVIILIIIIIELILENIILYSLLLPLTLIS